MKCPYCGHPGDKVVDSRESKEGEVIRRRGDRGNKSTADGPPDEARIAIFRGISTT